MKCPHCHQESTENPCSHCRKNLYDVEVTQNKHENVIEPEIVDENEPFRKNNAYGDEYTSYQQNMQGGASYKRYTVINNPQGKLKSSCLPGLISLFLGFYVFFDMGFLAALGFMFFMVIGKGITFMIMLKNLARGVVIPPILLDCVVWAASFYLVDWLT